MAPAPSRAPLVALALLVVALAGCSAPDAPAADADPANAASPAAPSDAPTAPAGPGAAASARAFAFPADGGAPLAFALEGAAASVAIEGARASARLGGDLAAPAVAGPRGGGGQAESPDGEAARVVVLGATGRIVAANGTEWPFASARVDLESGRGIPLDGTSGARATIERAVAVDATGRARVDARDLPVGVPLANLTTVFGSTSLDAPASWGAGPVDATVDGVRHVGARVAFEPGRVTLAAIALEAALADLAAEAVVGDGRPAIAAEPLATVSVREPASLAIGGRAWAGNATLRATSLAGGLSDARWSLAGALAQLVDEAGKAQVEARLVALADGNGSARVALSLVEGNSTRVHLAVRESSGRALALAVEPVVEGSASLVRVSTSRLLARAEASQARPQLVYQPPVLREDASPRAFPGGAVDLGADGEGVVVVTVEAPRGTAGAHAFTLALRSASAATARVSFEVVVHTS